MIKYTLRCAKDHSFEAWFPSIASYDTEREKRRVACPMCGSHKIEKAPMAPSLSHGNNVADAPLTADAPARRAVRQYFTALRKHVEENFENVGQRFPDEARKMHYGEKKGRPIYGEATPGEVAALIEEGVDVEPLPGPERHDA